jgi:hypothetical protein
VAIAAGRKGGGRHQRPWAKIWAKRLLSLVEIDYLIFAIRIIFDLLSTLSTSEAPSDTPYSRPYRKARLLLPRLIERTDEV